MYTSVFLEEGYTSNVNSDFEASDLMLYGPYRCTCTATTTCPHCAPEQRRDHAGTPPVRPCAICQQPITLNIGQRGALTRGYRLYCSNRCRRASLRQYSGPSARQALEAEGITHIACGHCGRVHQLASLDNRRLGRWRITGRLYCPDNDRFCARAARKH